MTTEIEVIKDFIARFDYYMNKGDICKANIEMNRLCEYTLQKENDINETVIIGETRVLGNKDRIVDILKGYKLCEKPIVRMGMIEPLITIEIPHTRYEFYKKQYVSNKPTKEGTGSIKVW